MTIKLISHFLKWIIVCSICIAGFLIIDSNYLNRVFSSVFDASMDRGAISNIFNTYQKIIILYLLLGNAFYFFIIMVGFLNSRRKYISRKLRMDQKMVPLRSLPPISMIIPAYNEESNAVESVKSMLKVNYPEFEVIVCNDGSKDSTMSNLIENFKLFEVDLPAPKNLPSEQIKRIFKSELYQNLIVLDKVNGGKSDALNASINYSQYPLICCVDCDSILDLDGLTKVATPFIEDPIRTVAVGGVIRLANDTKIEDGRVTQTSIPWRWLPIIQVVEYLRAFLIGRMGWDYLDCNTIISGAFGLFNKQVVIEAGGYDPNCIGEDFELLLRIHIYGKTQGKDFRVAFLPDPVCWTEAPEDLKTLGNQRSRWQQGLGESLWKSKKILFAPWGGRIGWIALPYLWIYELFSAPLELVGYLIIILGLSFDLISIEIVTLLLIVSLVFGATLNLGAIIVEEFTFKRYPKPIDFFKLIIGAIAEQIVFRQLNLYWRTRGMYRWFKKSKEWGDMKRVGFSSPNKEEN